MIIDSAHGKLTERHEALAESVKRLTIDLRKLETLVAQMTQGINGLVLIVRSR